MKIAVISDLGFIGSGYFNIIVPICSKLAEKGHEIKIAGMGYKGEEHDFPFSIIPAQKLGDAADIVHNLSILWKFDILVVALDIPLQVELLRRFHQRSWKYVGIMPLEAGPLCLKWAMELFKMDKLLVISEFGTAEMQKRGISAEYLPVGLDTNSWIPPTEEDRKQFREGFGIAEDEFVVLTVADNQERKNLAAAFEIFSLANIEKSRYLIVTRENMPIGWSLRELASNFGISNKVMIFERGMPFLDLWSIYGIADAFLLTSKAEGLGMPIMEAMAMQVPVIGTDCTGIHELLADGRGILIAPEYRHIDTFGNAYRFWINKLDAANALKDLAKGNIHIDTEKSRQYMEGRTWEITALNMEKALQAAIS